MWWLAESLGKANDANEANGQRAKLEESKAMALAETLASLKMELKELKEGAAVPTTSAETEETLARVRELEAEVERLNAGDLLRSALR